MDECPELEILKASKMAGIRDFGDKVRISDFFCTKGGSKSAPPIFFLAIQLGASRSSLQYLCFFLHLNVLTILDVPGWFVGKDPDCRNLRSRLVMCCFEADWSRGIAAKPLECL